MPMLKKTLSFSNPAYLSAKLEQLTIEKPGVENTEKIPPKHIEDIGIVILDHPQITITHTLLSKLVANNAAVVTCDERHLPNGLFLPLSGHTLHSQRFKQQLESSIPLKKGLWQQTIKAKIMNQAALLEKIGKPAKRLYKLAEDVSSGDMQNREGQAAAIYWPQVFDMDIGGEEDPWHNEVFLRERTGDEPNNMLNYTYAVLRAIVARALVGAGLLPVLGIHHRNQYNAYCLADDIMEPYRPYADYLVLQVFGSGLDCSELTPNIKQQLLMIASADTMIDGQRSPLFVATQRTAVSLAKCFAGDSRKILYPQFS
jgi:CRISP-associated protein Cas1